MGQQTKIEHTYTDKIVCPYCGYTFQDSWEFSRPDNIRCSKCDMAFEMDLEIEPHYTTCKNCRLNNQEHSFVLDRQLDVAQVYVCATCGKTRFVYPDGRIRDHD